jgi:hypothetical protein
VSRQPLQATLLQTALRATADALSYPSPVEIVLVGGAAGMLTGLLPAHRTTQDCDVMVYAPAQAWHAVETAAASVARRLRLSPTWLNGDVQMLVRRLPQGWESRRISIARYGRAPGEMIVFAVGRLDLIAMKFIAGRVQDREDLASLNVSRDDASFVRAYLASLQSRGEHTDHIKSAIDLLESMRPQEGSP